MHIPHIKQGIFPNIYNLDKNLQDSCKLWYKLQKIHILAKITFTPKLPNAILNTRFTYLKRIRNRKAGDFLPALIAEGDWDYG